MKFRNHISVVFEQLGAAFGVIFILLVTNIDDLIEFVENGTSEEIGTTALIGVGVVFGIMILVCVYQLILWSKTYISICDNSIVIERNTLNKKKNTIGIKNISNVNTERNLFEMVAGTSKVKLDTNSLSTSDKTDVKIVLKKADAERFRMYVMNLMRQEEGTEDVENPDEEKMQWDVNAGLSEILVHGFFSINIISILVVIGCIVGVVEMTLNAVEKANAGEGIIGMLLNFALVIVVLVSAIWDIMKDFIRYYDFKIARKGDKLYIRYGILKKVNYTIPVEKINALKLKQTSFARMAGRYMAEIINIGMGDDAAEAQSFFLPYCKKTEILDKIRMLIPEFEEAADTETVRQPKGTWLAWVLPMSLYGIFVVIGVKIAVKYLSIKWIFYGVTGFTVWMAILLVFRYLTAGSALNEQYIILANGYFTKTICYISYSKI